MKRIVIDPFDPVSVSAAIVQLVQFREELKRKVHKLCEVLARDYALKTVAVDCGYTEGGNIVCEVEEIPNGYIVRAAGEPVFFLEYGTGPSAGTGPILGTAPVSTAPGSWSAEHAGTYQAWVDAGMPGPYRYEHAPRAGMYYAFRAATENVQKAAEEVFRT